MIPGIDLEGVFQLSLLSNILQWNHVCSCLPFNGNGNGGKPNGNCTDGNGNCLSLHRPHVLLQTSACTGIIQFLAEIVMQRWE